MNTQLCFLPVIECPWHDDESPIFRDLPPLWDVATDIEPFSFVSLSAKTTDLEVGLIIARLIEYNNLESQGDLTDRLTEIIDYRGVDDGDYLLLPGGIEVSGDGLYIKPGCCCGLEAWREWIDFLSTGYSPYLGHDRDTPHLEKVNENLIRIWMNGNHTDIDRQIFELKLAEVQKNLADFLVRIDAWANSLGFATSARLAAKFDRCFSVSKQWNI